MKKANSNKESNKATVIETTNTMIASGVVERITYQSDKLSILTLKTFSKTTKGTQGYNFIPVKIFNGGVNFEVGDKIRINGYINNEHSNNNGKDYYNTYVVVAKDGFEECDFND